MDDGGGFMSFTPSGTNGYIGSKTADIIESVTEGEYYLVEFDIQSKGEDHWCRLNMSMTGTPFSSMEIRPIFANSSFVTQRFLMYADFTGASVRTQFHDLTTIGFNIKNISVRKVDKDIYTYPNSFFAYNETGSFTDAFS